MHRDGRDAMTSEFVFENFHSPHAAADSVADHLRFTRDGLQRPAYWDRHVRSWLQEPGVTMVRFVDILKDTAAVLGQLGDLVGEAPRMTKPLLPRRLSGKLSARIQRFLGTAEATTIVGRRRAADKPPNWRECFTTEDRRLFDEQAGDLLIGLGYEADHTWAARTE